MKAINIWVTTNCNLNCKYCYEHGNKKGTSISSNDIPLIIEFVFSFLNNESEIAINFHGGEPLLQIELIDEICNKLKDRRIKKSYSLTTNGTMITKENLNIVKKHNINLSVSIDGTKDNHNKMRIYHDNTGSYEKCVSGIKLALSVGVDVRGRMTVTPDNYQQLYKNVCSIASLGVNNIVAMPDLYSEKWTDEMISRIEIDINSIKKMNGKADFCFFEESVCKKGVCMGGRNEISIMTNLDLYPCTCVVGNEKYKIGNLRNKTWNNKIIHKINKLNKEMIETCNGCSFFSMCFTSRCRLYNEVLTGFSNRASEVVCAFENMIYRINNNH